MKKPGLFAVVLAAAILCATPLSLHWSSNTMPSLSFDRADAQNRVAGANRRIGRTADTGRPLPAIPMSIIVTSIRT